MQKCLNFENSCKPADFRQILQSTCTPQVNCKIIWNWLDLCCFFLPRQTIKVEAFFWWWSAFKQLNTMGQHVKPSFPLLHSKLSSVLSPELYESILPKHGCPFKQLLTYKSKSTKYSDIVFQLTWEQVFHTPTVQIWARNSTILRPNYVLTVLTVWHSSFTILSHNILSGWKVNVHA